MLTLHQDFRSVIIIFLRLLQPVNALLIELTLDPIVSSTRFLQFLNASFAIVSTPFPVLKLVNALHAVKAFSPIDFTLSGMIMLSSTEQFPNA